MFDNLSRVDVPIFTFLTKQSIHLVLGFRDWRWLLTINKIYTVARGLNFTEPTRCHPRRLMREAKLCSVMFACPKLLHCLCLRLQEIRRGFFDFGWIQSIRAVAQDAARYPKALVLKVMSQNKWLSYRRIALWSEWVAFKCRSLCLAYALTSVEIMESFALRWTCANTTDHLGSCSLIGLIGEELQDRNLMQEAVIDGLASFQRGRRWEATADRRWPES